VNRIHYKILIIFFLTGALYAAQSPDMQEKAESLLAAGVGKMAVQYEGVITTIDSVSQNELFYITGRKKIMSFPPTYAVLSMMYEFEQWKKEELIPIKMNQMKEALNLPLRQKYLSVETIIAPHVREELERLFHQSEHAKLREEAYLIYSRAMRFMALQSRLKIIPPEEPQERLWESPFEKIGQEGSTDLNIMALHRGLRHFFGGDMNESELRKAVDEFVKEARRRYSAYPSEWRLNLDSFYACINPFRIALGIFFIASCAWFACLLKRTPTTYTSAMVLTLLGLLVHLAGFVIRQILAGFVPLSNMYESLVFFTGAVVLIALVVELYNRKGIIGGISALLAFIILVVLSMMPPTFSRIVPLMAVLNSAWLTYHVITCMLAYAAFGLAFIVSLLFLGRAIAPQKVQRLLPRESFLDELNYRFIQIGWPLLTIGILTGAVWADTAWGAAWSWDPKETWSLITWLVYAGFLHLRLIMGKKGKVTAIASIVGFIAVLITWFGVSYLHIFGGGLHTYA